MPVTLYRLVGKGKDRRYQKVNLGRVLQPAWQGISHWKDRVGYKVRQHGLSQHASALPSGKHGCESSDGGSTRQICGGGVTTN